MTPDTMTDSPNDGYGRPAPEAEPASAKRLATYRTRLAKYDSAWRLMASLLVLGVAWELVARNLVETALFLVPLTEVFASGVDLWRAGELQRHIWTSGQAFGWGYLAAVGVGVPFGLLLAFSKRIRGYVEPLMSALYSTPLVAISPLLILALGIGVVSKIAIVFLVAIFPIFINTMLGFSTTDPSLIDVARSFNATPWQRFKYVLLPSAVPALIAGLRLAVGRGIVGVVVGELFGARAGLGWLIFHSSQSFNTANLYVGILLLALAGTIMMSLLEAVERRVARWRTT